MEFKFDISHYLKTHIVRVASNLLPQGFNGDRRGASEAAAKISEIINELGEASARAQGLNKPVTTSQKLRNSDQIVYLLPEKTGKNGCVTGLLKVGVKNLYVFDANGDTQMVPAPCILDFYIHESRQRAGLGKELFQAMLEREGWIPRKLAIDRPSEKLVGFLRKHYDLVKTIPQMNNFVVYEGFFDSDQNDNVLNGNAAHKFMHVSASPNTALFGPNYTNDENQGRALHMQPEVETHVQHSQNTPTGRYGAKRPTCSMAEIIQGSPSTITSEPHSTNGSIHGAELDQNRHHGRYRHHDEVDNITEHHSESDNKDIHANEEADDDKEEYPDIVSSLETLNISHSGSDTAAIDDIIYTAHKEVKFVDVSDQTVPEQPAKKPARYTKQHTGLKNLSFNVGAAVAPTDKMEFDQEERESFGVVKINRPIGGKTGDNSDDQSTVSSVGSEGLTEQGHFDLKFFHNRLW